MFVLKASIPLAVLDCGVRVKASATCYGVFGFLTQLECRGSNASGEGGLQGFLRITIFGARLVQKERLEELWPRAASSLLLRLSADEPAYDHPIFETGRFYPAFTAHHV